MAQYSVAQAKDNLSDLLNRAENGEEVIITRHGHPIAEVKSIVPKPRPMTKEDVDWLVANVVGTIVPEEDAATFVRRMRDEEWSR